MTWWRRLVGGTSGRETHPTDFLAEALELESRGDFANALTSYRLALRERPDDLRVLQNIAIVFSKTSQPEEAIRSYRRALQLAPDLAAAHYGLAFLLLKRGDTAHAAMHLEAFLRSSKEGDAATAKFREHATNTLNKLKGISSDGAETGIPNDVIDDASAQTGAEAGDAEGRAD